VNSIDTPLPNGSLDETEELFWRQLRLDRKLVLAVKRGQPDKIALLLGAGASPNKRPHPLCLAIRHRQPASLLVLLEGGLTPFPSFLPSSTHGADTTYQILKALSASSASMSKEELSAHEECVSIFNRFFPAEKLVKFGASLLIEQIDVVVKHQGHDNLYKTFSPPRTHQVMDAGIHWLAAIAVYMPENFSEQLKLLLPKLPPPDELWPLLLGNPKTSKDALDALNKTSALYYSAAANKSVVNTHFHATTLCLAWRGSAKRALVKPSEAQLWTLDFLLSISRQNEVVCDEIFKDFLANLDGPSHQSFLKALAVHQLADRVKGLHFTAGLLGSSRLPSSMSSWLCFAKSTSRPPLKGVDLIHLFRAGHAAAVSYAFKNMKDPNQSTGLSAVLPGVHAVLNWRSEDFPKLASILKSFGVDFDFVDATGESVASALGKKCSTPEHIAWKSRRQLSALDKNVATPVQAKVRGRL
jgi:hypothetical protein